MCRWATVTTGVASGTVNLEAGTPQTFFNVLIRDRCHLPHD